MTRVADEALLLLRMDTDIAPADLASGRAVPVGAACRRGVHDAPPGCAWKHCHEKYVWTPVCFTTSPHHGLVWSYRGIHRQPDPLLVGLLLHKAPHFIGLSLELVHPYVGWTGGEPRM